MNNLSPLYRNNRKIYTIYMYISLYIRATLFGVYCTKTKFEAAETNDIEESDINIIEDGYNSYIEFTKIGDMDLCDLKYVYTYRNVKKHIMYQLMSLYNRIIKIDGVCHDKGKYPLIYNSGAYLSLDNVDTVIYFIFVVDSGGRKENIVYRTNFGLVNDLNDRTKAKIIKAPEILLNIKFHRYGHPNGAFYTDQSVILITFLMFAATLVSTISYTLYKKSNTRIY